MFKKFSCKTFNFNFCITGNYFLKVKSKQEFVYAYMSLNKKVKRFDSLSSLFSCFI